MEFITQWITQIVLLILLAMVLELLLPNDSFQRYVRMVIGLVIIIALLSPIMKLFNTPIDEFINEFSPPQQDDQLTKSINEQKKEIQETTRAYIEKQTGVFLKNNVQEELIAQYDLAIKKIDIDLVMDVTQGPPKLKNIKHVDLTLGQAETNSTGKGSESQGRDEQIKVEPVQEVQEVTVQVTTEEEATPEAEKVDGYDEVKKFLATRWGIPSKHLTLRMEGGGQ